MAKDRDHEPYGESMKRDTKAEPEESLNAYYTRKQRTKGNKLAGDCDAEFAPPDRDADQEENFKNPDAGPMNFKKWDRFGR